VNSATSTGLVGRDRAALEQDLVSAHQRSELGNALGDRQVQRPVQHHPEGPVVVVFPHKHHGVAKARIVETRARDEETVSLASGFHGKMNAFDFVVPIALGLLIGLQYLVAWSASRSEAFDDLLKAEPVMVFHRGRFLRATMRRERVTRNEILAAIRGAGIMSSAQVESVVLETAGEFSIVKRPHEPVKPETDALQGLLKEPAASIDPPPPEAAQA
jgi:hypothetical protein